MHSYSQLSGIYDVMMDDFDYPRWADYYIEIMRAAGVEPKKLCDCACGTGLMTMELASRGYSIVGVDISEAMLANAASKSRARGLGITYVRQDMCALALPKKVDAITCACDGVNYLTTHARLSAFFESAAKNLKPGGCLAFDFSSRAKLEGKLGDRFFCEEREDMAYIWENKLDSARHIIDMDITFFVREDNGLYRRFTETHRQRAHEPGEISALLENSGFEDIRTYGDMTFEAPSDGDMRIHMTALRSGR